MNSKFLTESTGEKIVKIGQYLAKIWTKYDSLVFLGHPVVLLRFIRLFLTLTSGSGERCELPQRRLGRSPSRNRIWCILAVKYDIWWQQF